MGRFTGFSAVGALLVASAASAQPYALTQIDGEYLCDPVECIENESCEYNIEHMGTCRALTSGALICTYERHDWEAYCCVDGAGCPDGTNCVPIADESFGLCQGSVTEVKTCSADPGYLDVDACRDLNWPGYDWSHGDCDNDEIYNEDEDEGELCDGPGFCGCWADIDGEDRRPSISGYEVSSSDLMRITRCIENPAAPECTRADVNCDGVVDACDAEVVQDAIDDSPDYPELNICRTQICGETAADSGVADGGSSGTRLAFRGGGCECRSATGSATGIVPLLATLALLFVRRRYSRS